MHEPRFSFLANDIGTPLAYDYAPGAQPAVVFLGGYRSEMTGTKGEFLAAWCRERGQAFLRLDYSGHGLSGGEFVDGTIGRWRDDALAVIEHCLPGPCVLVGSSMGGWIMLLVARALGARVRGLVGIAAAPDFTRDLMWDAFDAATREALNSDGIVYLPSEYDEAGLPVRKTFIDDGDRHRQLVDDIPLTCPVYLLQGRRDADVPWTTAERLAERLAGDDVTVTYFKDGDHRLSSPPQLDYLAATVAHLLGRLGHADGDQTSPV